MDGCRQGSESGSGRLASGVPALPWVGVNLIAYLIAVVFSGLIVGGLSRLVIPGRQQMGTLATLGLGVAGSVLGGIVGAVLFRGTGRILGLILAVACGAGLLWVAIRQKWVKTAPR